MNNTYLALLRGINVGGKNVIKMSSLRACFENMGFSDVRTYIQSGNVIFHSSISDPRALERTIEQALSKQFKYASRVVVLSRNDLAGIIKQAPKDFGTLPEKFRYDVIFLKKPLTPVKTAKAVETKDGVDALHVGKHALYTSRLIARATQSRLSKLSQTPEYQHMTIRNWNTATKLLALMG